MTKVQLNGGAQNSTGRGPPRLLRRWCTHQGRPPATPCADRWRARTMTSAQLRLQRECVDPAWPHCDGAHSSQRRNGIRAAVSGAPSGRYPTSWGDDVEQDQAGEEWPRGRVLGFFVGFDEGFFDDEVEQGCGGEGEHGGEHGGAGADEGAEEPAMAAARTRGERRGRAVPADDGQEEDLGPASGCGPLETLATSGRAAKKRPATHHTATPARNTPAYTVMPATPATANAGTYTPTLSRHWPGSRWRTARHALPEGLPASGSRTGSPSRRRRHAGQVGQPDPCGHAGHEPPPLL